MPVVYIIGVPMPPFGKLNACNDGTLGSVKVSPAILSSTRVKDNELAVPLKPSDILIEATLHPINLKTPSDIVVSLLPVVNLEKVALAGLGILGISYYIGEG
jgi:hypothetical protein